MIPDGGIDLADLVDRLRVGDPDAHRTLDRLYRRRLTGYCRSRLDNGDEAEDCVQDTLLAALGGVGGLRDAHSLTGWLFGIAKHKVAERNHRHRVALNRLVDPSVLDTEPEYLHAEGADTELRVGKRELLPIVAVAMRSLSPQLRLVLTEVIWSPDIRGSELARRLGWDVRKADHELNRARTELLDAVGIVFVVWTGRQDCPRLDGLCRDQAIPVGRHAGLTEQQRRRVQRHVKGCLFICRPRAAKGRDRGEWAIGPALARLAEAAAGRPALLPPVGVDRERRRSAAGPGSARPPRGLARLIQRGSDLLTAGTVRVTHLPGVATAIRFTGDNPRTASAAAVTMVAITAGVILAMSPGTPSIGATPAPSATTAPPATGGGTGTPTQNPGDPHGQPPSTTADPGRPGDPVPPGGPVLGSTVSPTVGPTAGTTGTAQAGPTSPPAPATGTTIDARALSYDYIGISNHGSWHPRDIQTLQLPPGRYTIVAVSATPITITIDQTGTVDYDPALAYLSGRGTHTLTLSGLPVTIDGTPLAYQYVTFSSALPWLPNDTRHTVRLLPGRYTFYGAGATGIPITLTPTGTIDYDPNLAYVSGRGTNTVTVSGLPVTIDATRLAATTFAITPATGWLDSRTPQAMRLLPGQYHLYIPNQRNPTITLTPTGTFDYDPTLTGISGAGTNTLTVW